MFLNVIVHSMFSPANTVDSLNWTNTRMLEVIVGVRAWAARESPAAHRGSIERVELVAGMTVTRGAMILVNWSLEAVDQMVRATSRVHRGCWCTSARGVRQSANGMNEVRACET